MKPLKWWEKVLIVGYVPGMILIGLTLGWVLLS